jgi:chaperonin GroEL
MTAATLIDNEYGLKLEDVELKHLGSAKMIKADREFIQINGGNFTQESMYLRIKQIQDTINNEPSMHLKNLHKERMARLQVKIAEIKI